MDKNYNSLLINFCQLVRNEVVVDSDEVVASARLSPIVFVAQHVPSPDWPISAAAEDVILRTTQQIDQT